MPIVRFYASSFCKIVLPAKAASTIFKKMTTNYKKAVCRARNASRKQPTVNEIVKFGHTTYSVVFAKGGPEAKTARGSRYRRFFKGPNSEDSENRTRKRTTKATKI